jgi:hypothetical protein
MPRPPFRSPGLSEQSLGQSRTPGPRLRRVKSEERVGLLAGRDTT